MKTEVIYASVQGAAHKRTNKDNQDSYKILNTDNAIIIAVADGHGSESCPFSKDGSRIACEVFCDLLGKLCASIEPGKLMRTLNRDGDINISQKIDSEWKRRVCFHYKEANNTTQAIDHEAIWRLYGTTLLGLVITPTFYFSYQLGDGDILIFFDSKAKYIIDNEKILGVQTHSLSRKDAWKKTITCVERLVDKNSEQIFMLATDGFSNSYPNEEAFLAASFDYYDSIMRNGADAVSLHLEEWLNETSEKGSGDDITVLFLVVG